MRIRLRLVAAVFGAALACSAGIASAQLLVIHWAPQGKATYASPAEWPIISAQCHWNPAVVPEMAASDFDNLLLLGDPAVDGVGTHIMGMGVTGHTHSEPQFPVGAEVTGAITVPWTFKLFHAKGRIVAIYSPGNAARQIVWDADNSMTDPVSNPYGLPSLMGDPMGLKTWTAKVTFDFTKVDHNDPYRYSDHGWFLTQLIVRTVFDDGSKTETVMNLPLFSMINPAIPEIAPPPSQGIPLGAGCFGEGVHDTPSGVGAAQVSFNTLPPIFAPLTEKVILPVNASQYGFPFTNAPNGVFMERLNMDIHNGIAGALLEMDNSTLLGSGTDVAVFDPAVIGTGTHKVALTWANSTGPNPDGSFGLPFGQQPPADEEAITALLVLNVTVGAVTPPPPPPPNPCVMDPFTIAVTRPLDPMAMWTPGPDSRGCIPVVR